MPSIERKFTLQVPSSTENLALIREFVTAVAARRNSKSLRYRTWSSP